MKLALTYTDHNPYAICGIFIEHASPKVWLAALTRMQLNLSDCKIYPCPGLEANSISGALVILQTDQKNIDVGNTICIQQVRSNFFIPEHTQLNMALTNDEYVKLLSGKPHFFHHELGLIELTEKLRWETILEEPREQFPTIETPAKGVRIPSEVTVFSIEIEEAEEAAGLENSFGDSKVDPKDLPFDMKKVLKGNNAEVEKYLKYLEQNPEAALKMAIPLDMMGTSRGKAFANYRFESNFFESIGFGNISEKTKSSLKTIFGIVAILFIFWIGYEVVHAVKQQQYEVVTGETTGSSDTNEESLEETLVLASENTDENNTDVAEQDLGRSAAIKNTSSKTNIVQNIILVFAIISILLLIFYLAKYQKKKTIETKKDKKTSWLDLPEESELFSFTEEEKDTEKGFYFGGDELSMTQKLLIFLILIGIIVYLFYPMMNTDGFPRVLLFIAVFFVVRMLYKLLNKNKKFTEDDA